MRAFLIFVSIVMFQTVTLDSAVAGSVFVYEKPKVAHVGKEATPLEAYDLIQKDAGRMFIVDVRTQAEYQFVGHPVGAVLVPFQFMGPKFTGKEYEMVENTNFTKDILARFNPKTDTLFFLCRSGTRAAVAVNTIVEGGWPADKAYVILGGFEGEKMKDKNSAFDGQRVGGGWRNEGLPWSYSLDEKLIY